MAHGHHHHHGGESVRDYFTEQLLTILVCMLIGFAAIQMYRTDRLGFLAEQFRKPVLYGGIAIIGLVVLRAVAVWKEAGEVQAQLQCEQDHVHSQDCNHVHILAHEDEDHEHSHDLSWVFARMLVLVFPVLLFFMGLPSAALSQAAQERLLGNDSAMGAEMLKDLAKDAMVYEEKTQDDGTVVRILISKTGLKIRETRTGAGGEPRLQLVSDAGVRMKFNDINDIALSEEKRKLNEGTTVIMEGRFKRLADKEFTLFRMKMTCCAADTVPLKVRIVVPQALSGFEYFDWVQVKGQIQFVQVQGQNRYIPVIMVADITDVRKTDAKNEYEQ